MPIESFWVLKTSFVKKYKMKERKRNPINNFFLVKFKKWKIYFRPLVLAALKGRIEV